MQEEQFIDVKKWRKTFNSINNTLVIVIFGVELAMFVLLLFQDNIERSIPYYTRRYIVMPTLENLAIVTISYFLRKGFSKNEKIQNALPIFTLAALCTVVTATHYTFSNTIAILCIPVFMTVVFENHKLCRATSLVCLVGIAITMLTRHLFGKGFFRDSDFVPETIIAIVVVVVVEKLTQKIIHMLRTHHRNLVMAMEAAEEAKEREMLANNAKSAFLANMSHEIRTPINAILGMNELILRETKDQNVLEYAENVQTAGNTLLHLVNDVLDISKIESGKLEIVDVEYETASVIHDCYNLINERAKKKQLKVEVKCEGEIPCKLYGDEVRIRQIITNLLTNAVKYTNEGSVTLNIRFTDNRLRIEVLDTGIGMKPQVMSELFDTFSRFDMERNRNIEGTGLGLAITKQLVELMQGTINVSSEYGKGSCFTVEIPQQVRDMTPIADIEASTNHNTQGEYTYKELFVAPDARIMVVDDVPVNREVFARLLKNTQMQIDKCESGAECIKRVQQAHYDIIFMDHMMPQMDGVETFRMLKEKYSEYIKDTPVIMLTANAISGVKQEYMDEGFCDYLSKPIKADKLERMLARYLPAEKIQKTTNK